MFSLSIPGDTLDAAAKPLVKSLVTEIAEMVMQAAQSVNQDLRDGLADKEDIAGFFKRDVRTIERWILPAEHKSGHGLGMPHLVLPGGQVRFVREQVLRWALKTFQQNQPPETVWQDAA